jgi:hypothetical protein
MTESLRPHKGFLPTHPRSEGEVLLEQKQRPRVARSFGGPLEDHLDISKTKATNLSSLRDSGCCWTRDGSSIVGPADTSKPVEMPAVVSISRHLP